MATRSNSNHNKKGNTNEVNDNGINGINGGGGGSSGSNVIGDAGNILNTRSRHRKISVKQKLKIYKPSDLKNLDQDELQQREVVDNIETGVEKSEEREVHLYKILTQQQNSDNKSVKTEEKTYIPTPSTQQNWDEFNSFYHGQFIQPKNYIKFSATVEDCCGTTYNMDEKDELFLNKFNSESNGASDDKSKDNSKLTEDNSKDNSKLTEDEFELLCASFEHAIKERQPFLSMDPESILTFEELKPTLLKSDFANFGLRSNLATELNYKPGERFITQFEPIQIAKMRPLGELIELFGTQIYDYWKFRKIEANGEDIFPQLKFEKPGEREEVDPYVCFRRREVRHPRKTRRIDVINSHKLKLLYRELQHAKEMALIIAKRELKAFELMNNETTVFDERLKIVSLKRELNISGEDDDLINHKRRRPNIMTIERRKQIEQEEAEEILRKNAAAQAAAQAQAQAAAAAAASLSSPSFNNLESSSNNNSSTNLVNGLSKRARNKLTKKQLEQLTKSSEKLAKQQLQAQLSKSDAKLKSQQQLQKKQEPKVPQQSIASHVYVKLPSCKVPDIVLDDVDNILTHKEKNARKFVHDRMEKRKLEDGDQFFNLTDDPFNPVFDISLPKNVDPTTAPFASIASSKFVIDKSYYVPNFSNYLQGNTDDITVFNKDGEKVISDNLQKAKKVEIYNPFQTHNEIHSREYPVKFRRRFGRNNIQYIDRKPNSNSVDTNKDANDMLSQLFDFNAIEQETNKVDEYIDVYESKADELTRLHDKWKYDSPSNDYGMKFSEGPSRLNQILNQTQVIRFGTMLGTKSYEQLRKATLKYRREYIHKLKQQKTMSQKQQLQPIQTGISNGANQKSSSSSRHTSKTPKLKNESASASAQEKTKNS